MSGSSVDAGQLILQLRSLVTSLQSELGSALGASSDFVADAMRERARCVLLSALVPEDVLAAERGIIAALELMQARSRFIEAVVIAMLLSSSLVSVLVVVVVMWATTLLMTTAVVSGGQSVCCREAALRAYLCKHLSLPSDSISDALPSSTSSPLALLQWRYAAVHRTTVLLSHTPKARRHTTVLLSHNPKACVVDVRRLSGSVWGHVRVTETPRRR